MGATAVRVMREWMGDERGRATACALVMALVMGKGVEEEGCDDGVDGTVGRDGCDFRRA